MKTIYTSLSLFLIVSAHAQSLDSSGTATFHTFQRYTNNILRSHVCEETANKKAAIVTSTTFDTLIRPIFGKVIVGANDLINQGSAYSLSFDKTSALFALNYSLEKDKDEPKHGFLILASPQPVQVKRFSCSRKMNGKGESDSLSVLPIR